jgi:hypothetical protein
MKKLIALTLVSLLLLFAFPFEGGSGAGAGTADFGKLITTAEGSQTGVFETTADLQAYTFYTTQSGQRIYKASTVIRAGSLVKIGACVSGYAQVEYQEDGWWKVDYLACR